MKKLIFLISIVGFLSFFNSCSAGYVSEVPVYQTYNRPQSPGNEFTWIDGGWKWNRRTNSYIQVNGNWKKQREGHTYKQGYWKKNRHGSQWQRGSYR